MKVVLTANVEKLGHKGEMKDVKDGYGRNYLLPTGLAVEAFDSRAKQLLEEGQRLHEEQTLDEKKAQEMAEAVAGKKVNIKVKVGAKKQLYAAVDEEAIIKAVKEQLGIRPEKVSGEPIKQIGEYEVQLHFGHGKQVAISVEVLAEESSKKEIRSKKK